MYPISYSISPAIREVLNGIDHTRITTLHLVLPPATLRRIAWDNAEKRLINFAHLESDDISHGEIGIIMSGTRKPVNDLHKSISNYRQTVSAVNEEWTGSQRQLTWNNTETILTRLSRGIRSRYPWTNISEKPVRETLAWIGSLEEHPVIAAAIIYGAIASQINSVSFHPTGTLLAYAVLAKSGYHGQGLLTLEDGLARMPQEITDGMTAITKDGNFTPWITHFTNLTDRQYTRLLETLNSAAYTETPAFFALTDRQRHILGLSDAPGVQITNRKVANTFNISQITASRELAHLTTLGLLMKHGKGRSVYYTKL
jgi:hypothetical protein